MLQKLEMKILPLTKHNELIYDARHRRFHLGRLRTCDEQDEEGERRPDGTVYSKRVGGIICPPGPVFPFKGKTKGKPLCGKHKKNPATIAVTGFLIGGDTRI